MVSDTSRDIRRRGGDIDLDLRLDLDAPGMARRVVAEALGRHPALPDLLLATSELVTNAVRHSRQAHGRLRVRVGADRVRIELAHPGPGFLRPPSRQGRALAPDGRGLQIVDALVNAWGVDLTGSETNVWFELDGRGGGGRAFPPR